MRVAKILLLFPIALAAWCVGYLWNALQSSFKAGYDDFDRDLERMDTEKVERERKERQK